MKEGETARDFLERFTYDAKEVIPGILDKKRCIRSSFWIYFVTKKTENKSNRKQVKQKSQTESKSNRGAQRKTSQTE